jgi:hypothetical protein
VVLLAAGVFSCFYRFGYKHVDQAVCCTVEANGGEIRCGVQRIRTIDGREGGRFIGEGGAVFERCPPPQRLTWFRSHESGMVNGQVVQHNRWYYVPLWLPLLVIGTPTACMFWRRHRRIPPGHCRRCGYNLMGNVSGICPECGERI